MEDAIRNQDAKSVVQFMRDCMPSVDSKDSGQQKLQDLKALLNLCVSEVGRVIAQSAKDEALAVGSGGEAFIVIPDAQLIEPRGRFTVSLSSEGMLLEGKAMNVFFPWAKVSHIACVPSNVSVKKEGEELMAFLLSEPVKCNNKDTKMFLWNLSKSRVKELSATTPSSTITGSEHVVVSTLVAMSCKKIIITPNKELFQSVTMQRPYLKCYRGIQEGALYPLKNGLVFLKPLLFIPTEEIASITAERGGGSTRYVDLKIETVEGKTHEFTNIEREELLAIQIFVNEYLEARKRAEAKAEKALKIKQEIKGEPGIKEEDIKEEVGEEGEEGGNDEDDDDDDESSDEDFDPDASDSEASGRDSDDSQYSGSDNEAETVSDSEEKAPEPKKKGPKKKRTPAENTEKKSPKSEKKSPKSSRDNSVNDLCSPFPKSERKERKERSAKKGKEERTPSESESAVKRIKLEHNGEIKLEHSEGIKVESFSIKDEP